jgi:hypothetical protein
VNSLRFGTACKLSSRSFIYLLITIALIIAAVGCSVVQRATSTGATARMAASVNAQSSSTAIADSSTRSRRFGPSRRPGPAPSTASAPTPSPTPSPSPAPTPSTTGEQARSADAFVDTIGTNVHLHYLDTVYGNYALIRQRLIDSGIRHVRDGATVTTDPVFNGLALGHFADLATVGIKVDLIVDPRSISPVTTDTINSIKTLAGNGLESFEGPNEYDISGDSQWVQTLRLYQQDLYSAVKQTASTKNVPVLAPSLVQSASVSQLGNLNTAADYANMHSYSGGNLPSNQLEQLASLNDGIASGKPMIPTECGYHNALGSNGGFPAVSETAAGKYMPRLFLEYFNQGFPRTYTYEFIDEKADTTNNPEMHFGLLRVDGSAKPAFTAVANLIQILKDPGVTFSPAKLDYKLTGALNSIHHALLQKRDGRFYLILWQEISSFDLQTKQDLANVSEPVTVSFTNTAQNINVYFPMNSSAAIQTVPKTQQINVAVPDHPVVLELTF